MLTGRVRDLHKNPLKPQDIYIISQIMTSMRRFFTFLSIALILILLACVAGCTTSTPSPSTQAITTIPSTPVPAGTSSTTEVTAAAGVDTTVSVHFNDYSCLDMQKALGVDYLYPDEKYTVWVSTPGSGTITPNLLVLDVNDNTKLLSVKPVWDSVQKTWTYEGLVPLAKLIDITTP